MSGSAGRTAVIAGRGALPARIVAALEAAGEDPVIATLAGTSPDGLDGRAQEALEVERLVPFFDRLHDLGVRRVAFAGATTRPRLNPERFDSRTAQLVPRLVAAMQAGDDATLRAVLALFEEEGFEIAGTADLAPALLPAPGVLGTVHPDAAAQRDTVRAAEIVAALGAVDVGQGAIVARGLCLAVEALPGTDAMLAQVATLPEALRGAGRAGVLFKAPKPGQDRRIDLPALGPGTVAGAARAGLAGIAFEAGGVLLLDRAEAVAQADAAGLFLWARGPEG
ncbi:LpxI family protein [Rhodobaculum claviforme]|uniref:Phosphatidate cytidylyltransferase n=1 Tax=Rhodobaculum claviforme TaxID=1549854 RepID=A0A934WJ22_9RHOB|nr:UDP-2,3-diacylglucosamine diphosphatase LpxI [Rhodobaculum claviforme]MBK5927571.1 phosphatidate cytidylyltransferase [Rhodobaculum claviforme]